MRGDLLFVHGADFDSRLISLAERREAAAQGLDLHDPAVRTSTEVTHVALVLAGADGPRLSGPATVVEALWPKVHTVVRKDGERVAWGWRYEQARRDRALAWAEEQTGDEYSGEDLLANAARVLGLAVGVFETKSFDCSHFVFTVLTLAGEDWAASGYPTAADWVAAPSLVTPADLHGYCRHILAGSPQRPQVP